MENLKNILVDSRELKDDIISIEEQFMRIQKLVQNYQKQKNYVMEKLKNLDMNQKKYVKVV